MLTCPQCKFKNPNINKFCQNCGTSLTHKICPKCSTKIALNIQHCPQCSTECSTTSYALITQEEHQVVSVIPEPTQLTQNLENIANENSHTSPFHQIDLESYLDPQQRYPIAEIVTEITTQEKPDFSPTVLQASSEAETKLATENDDSQTILSMELSSLEYVAYTDLGRQRHHNEDYFSVDSQFHKLELPNHSIVTAQGLYILCDGMGGHAGGEIASELAVNTIRKYFQETWVKGELPGTESICDAIYLANQAIYELNQQESRSGTKRMGTTLVMLLLQNNQAAIAHVGDSRLYRLTHKQGLEQITIDHEVGQQEIARGVEPNIAYGRVDAYQLTQALGPRNEDYISPDVTLFNINEDMLLVLVLDGLSDNDCLETHWLTHLQPLLSYTTNLETGIQNLIELGNEYNGHDNLTAILVRVKVRPSSPSCL